jgi:hypothetical protein
MRPACPLSTSGKVTDQQAGFSALAGSLDNQSDADLSGSLDNPIVYCPSDISRIVKAERTTRLL